MAGELTLNLATLPLLQAVCSDAGEEDLSLMLEGWQTAAAFNRQEVAQGLERAIAQTIDERWKKLGLAFARAGLTTGQPKADLFAPSFIFTRRLQPQLYAEGGGGSSAVVLTNASIAPVLSDFSRAVVEKIRAKIIAAVQTHRHRNSPTLGVEIENKIVLSLAIDLDTGNILEKESPNNATVGLRLEIFPRENQIAIDPQTVAGIERTLTSEIDFRHRFVLEALLHLARNPFIIPPSDPLALEAHREETELLPPISVELLDANHLALTNAFGDTSMTVAGGLHLWSFYVGTVQMDEEGKIVGTHLRRPLEASPRGTLYEGGVVGAGSRIAVVLYELEFREPKIVWFQILDRLNAKQELSLRGLFTEGKKSWVDMERDNPGSLNEILVEEGFDPVPDSEIPKVRPSAHYFITRYLMVNELWNHIGGWLGLAVKMSGNQVTIEMKDEDLSSLLTSIFNSLYKNVVTEQTLNPKTITAFRQILFLIKIVREAGYEIPLDEEKLKTAKEKMAL